MVTLIGRTRFYTSRVVLFGFEFTALRIGPVAAAPQRGTILSHFLKKGSLAIIAGASQMNPVEFTVFLRRFGVRKCSEILPRIHPYWLLQINNLRGEDLKASLAA
jgi:hypothetical protein